MELIQGRLVLLAAFGWFLALSAVLPTSVAPFSYPYVLAWALLVLLSPTTRSFPLWLVSGAASAIFTTAAALGAQPLDATRWLTVAAIFVSLWIAKALANREVALERAVGLSMNGALRDPGSSGASYSSLYVELQRARTCQRALSVLAISPANSGAAEADGRASLASLLSEELRAFDLLAVRGDHFVAMLPETDSEEAVQLTTRLQSATREKLRLALDIGLSSFPEQEITLEGLLDRAESEMRADADSEVDTAKKSVKLEGSWTG